MPKIDVQLATPIRDSFRVQTVCGKFDVPAAKRATRSFSVHLPPLAGDGSRWSVGVIVGASGSGKGRVARQWLGDDFLERSPDRDTLGGWPDLDAVVDAFDDRLEMATITDTLGAVGFAEPPAWVLPYHCLSTGQRARCDLARALLLDRDVVGFDEFTSTVDRRVGFAMAVAAARAVRKGHVPLRRLVAVTCHHDIVDALEPDWVLNMDDRSLEVAPEPGKLLSRSLPRGCLRRRRKPWARPAIEVEVRRPAPGGGRKLWRTFGPHHYLSGKLHPAARCYVAIITVPGTGDPMPGAFCATIANAGWAGRRLVHRLVVLPDFQGMGVGTRFLEAVCSHESAEGYQLSIRTSHPTLIKALHRRAKWSVGAVSKLGVHHAGFSKAEGRLIGSFGRSVKSFRYRGDGCF